jgi:hypothetical protein
MIKLILKCRSVAFSETIHVRVRDLGEEHEIEDRTPLGHTQRFTL